jgi:serine/threonine-protein kinase
MALSPGTRIGSYEVVGPLGAGGMGEVYRARDERLGRDAAIKILPDAFLNDADRVARFEREARTLASLNHPNIAQIYGFEGDGSPADHGETRPLRALVMELVEGEDLSAILARGPVALADALPIARQIASALEAAHEQGIVHRDLKPANVKVRPDGTVKVLDFGLARPGGSGDVSGSITNSPTMTSPATAFGMIIGTAAYMSPEQARGKAVDKRADVWAFGVVLYEMLSGRRAYPGSELSDVLASVLKDTLPLDSVPADTPAPIRRLLRRCLEKDRADRLDSMATARLEIADAMTPARDDGPRATVLAPPDRRRTMVWAAAAVVAASAITGFVVWFARTPEPPQPVAFVLAPPGGEAVRVNVNQPDLAISPDGRRIAYSHGGIESTIVVRTLDEFGDRPLGNLGELPRSPFFSPDGRWLGYYTGQASGVDARLMKVAPGGGTPLEIGSVATNLRGASWGRDDLIVFATGAAETGLFRISAAGGESEILTRPDAAAGELDHRWPVWMPDGKHVVFSISRRTTGTVLARDLAVLDLATRKWRVIKEGGSYPRYVATGHLLFATERGVFAAPFDPVACEFRGEAVRVIEDVAYKGTSGAADYDVSDAGTLAFISGSSTSLRTLAWVDRTGTLTPIPAPPHTYDDVVVSPDGTRAILSISDSGTTVLHLYDFARGSLTPILPPAHGGINPVWSSNERDVYYRGLANGKSGIYRVSAAGASSPELILEANAGGTMSPSGITPDGQSLLMSVEAPAGREIHLLNLIGAPSPKRLVADPVSSVNGRVSPDGRWLAYTVSAGQGGTGDVFMRPFPNVVGDRVQVSVGGGVGPVWALDSRAIYYVGQGRVGVWRVDVSSSGQLGTPVQLLAGDRSASQQVDFVTGAGRVIRVRPVEATGKANELRVVLNWFELLKQKMTGAPLRGGATSR